MQEIKMDAMDRDAGRNSKNKFGFFFRAIVSVTLLLIVLSYVNFQMVLSLFARIDYFYFGLMVLLLLADRFLMAYKWNLLIRARGISLSIWQCLRVYLISGFFGAFLPSSIGSDIYRIYYTSKRQGSTEEIIASVVLERFIGVAAIATFAFMGLTWLTTTQPQPFFGANMTITVLAFMVLSLVGFWLSIQRFTLTGSEYILSGWKDKWFLKKWIQCQHAYVAYSQHKRTLVFFFLLSVFEQSFFVIANYWGARAMGLSIELIYFIGIVPICIILIRLPISINAIGVQEGLYVFFFSRLGLSITEAFSLSLLVRIAVWLVKVPGAILYITESSEQKQALRYTVK